MQSLDDDERRAILGEVLADQLQVILEYVSDIPEMKRDIAVLKTDVTELKSDMKIVKLTLIDNDRRLERLETSRI